MPSSGNTHSIINRAGCVVDCRIIRLPVAQRHVDALTARSGHGVSCVADEEQARHVPVGEMVGGDLEERGIDTAPHRSKMRGEDIGHVVGHSARKQDATGGDLDEDPRVHRISPAESVAFAEDDQRSWNAIFGYNE